MISLISLINFIFVLRSISNLRHDLEIPDTPIPSKVSAISLDKQFKQALVKQEQEEEAAAQEESATASAATEVKSHSSVHTTSTTTN